MDFELTESQQNVFEKIQAGDHYTIETKEEVDD
jgi:hypothetical protein